MTSFSPIFCKKKSLFSCFMGYHPWSSMTHGLSFMIINVSGISCHDHGMILGMVRYDSWMTSGLRCVSGKPELLFEFWLALCWAWCQTCWLYEENVRFKSGKIFADSFCCPIQYFDITFSISLFSLLCTNSSWRKLRCT